MPKVTMQTLLTEILKLDNKFTDAILKLDNKFTDAILKLDNKIDTRFDFVKEQMQNMDSKIDGLETRMDRLETKMDFEFSRVHKELKIIRDQTGQLTERVTVLEEKVG